MREEREFVKFTVSDLPDDEVSPADLRKLFSRFGDVEEVRIHSRERRVWALISMFALKSKGWNWPDCLEWRGHGSFNRGTVVARFQRSISGNTTCKSKS
jgi:hypothetical protein